MKFMEYTPNIARKYVNNNYPQCNKCFRPGYVRQLEPIKNKLKQELKNKKKQSKLTIKQDQTNI